MQSAEARGRRPSERRASPSRCGFASPYAATVSGDARMRTGIDVFERVVLAVERHGHLNARAADRLRLGVEANFGRAFRGDVDASIVIGCVEVDDRRIERLDRDRRLAGLLELRVHDARRSSALSPTREEARPRRREQQRLVDADLVLRPAEARRLVAARRP